MPEYAYTIKCQSCGKEWHYEQFTCYMQKINAFHCNCGGKLIVIRNGNDGDRSNADGENADKENNHQGNARQTIIRCK